MIRVGVGFDSHPFVEGRPLILGGQHIPYERGLAGYSDADAVAHALTDALLGAAGAGDMCQSRNHLAMPSSACSGTFERCGGSSMSAVPTARKRSRISR